MTKKIYHVRGAVLIFEVINPWIYVGVPKKHTQETRPFAQRGLVPITVQLGESRWDTSLLPKGDGTHFIALNAKIRKAEGIEIGQQIKLKYWLRTQKRKSEMSESIHGHEVMQMMIDLKRSFSKETLKEAIHTKFGKETRFHTCSAENMTAEELIDFLEGRGKFVDGTGGFTTDPDKICQH